MYIIDIVDMVLTLRKIVSSDLVWFSWTYFCEQAISTSEFYTYKLNNCQLGDFAKTGTTKSVFRGINHRVRMRVDTLVLFTMDRAHVV